MIFTKLKGKYENLITVLSSSVGEERKALLTLHVFLCIYDIALEAQAIFFLNYLNETNDRKLLKKMS